MQNTPNPDVNSPVTNDNYDRDTERENGNISGNENEEMPPPPDRRSNAPVEEPPDTREPAIKEDTNEPARIV